MIRKLSLGHADAGITATGAGRFPPTVSQAASRGVPVVRLILALPLFAAAFIDLPSRIDAGPVRGGGVLTILLAAGAAAGVLLSGTYPKLLLARTLPYLAFVVWTGLTAAWAPPGFWGFQNGIVYLLFGLLVVLAGTVAARDRDGVERLIRRGIRWIDCVALGIVFLNAATRGLPTVSALWWTGPRSAALLGLIPLGWHLSGWYHGVKRSFIPVCLWLAAIAVSLSRAAMAIAVLLVGVTCLLRLGFRLRKAAGALVFFLATVAIAGTLVTRNPAVRERFFGGDAALEVGGRRINTEGRLEIWNVVIASARESPMVGRGLGSSQVTLQAAFSGLSAVDHPHNDYLRLWHDLGLVGAALFSLAIASWVWILARGWYREESSGGRSARLEMAAALALLGVLLAMVTDNVVVYSFVMGPLGILVGAGLGAGTRRNGAPTRVAFGSSD